LRREGKVKYQIIKVISEKEDAVGYWLLAFGFEEGVDFAEEVNFFLFGGDFGGQGISRKGK
jgi:hypothetical protein